MRVLVVEDESLIAMLLEDMLEEAGCQLVGPFATLQPALDACANERFDAALIDLNLAGESADPIIDRLVERAIPFAVVTGDPHTEHGQRATAVLAKPFVMNELAETLRILAAAPRSRG